MIVFSCDNCGKAFKVPEAMAGKTGTCKQCGSPIRIPAMLIIEEDQHAVTEIVPPPNRPAPRPTPAPSVNVGVVVHHQGPGKVTSGLGVAAAVLGLLAILTCWIPIVNFGSLGLALIGGVLGVVGVLVALSGKRSGVGWPMVGILANGLAVAGFVAVNAILASAAIETGRAISKGAAAARVAREKVQAEEQARIDQALASTPSAEPAVTLSAPVPDATSVAAASPDAPKPIDPNMVPDPDWDPKPGDVAIAFLSKGGAVLVARDMFAFGELIKLLRANDTDGLTGMGKHGRISSIPTGTSIRVLKREDNRFITNGVEALEVRILDGRMKGESAWLPLVDAATLIHKGRLPVPKSEPKDEPAPKPKVATKPAPKPVDPAARAASALNVGELLEKSGKITQSISAYRGVIRDYPGTPGAEAAQKHLDALSGKTK